MGLGQATVSSARILKMYLFLSALAVNLFLQVIIIANRLSMQYFFYTTPMTIQIDFLSTLGNTLLWVGSLYVVYITKEVVERLPRFRLINCFLNMALIGSFFLLLSVFLTAASPSAEPATRLLPNQLWFLAESVGYTVSFAGSSLALLTIMTKDKGLLKLFLMYFFSLLIPIEIWSLMHWVAYPFNIMSYLGFAWRGAFIELQFFYLSYPLIFWLFIAFLFSWIWVPLVICTRVRIKQKQRIQIKALLSGSQSNIKLQNAVICEKRSDCKDDASRVSSTSRVVPAALLVSLFLGVFLACYPYINPEPGLVGWDTLGYYLSLSEMVNKDFFSAIQFAATTDRPLYFLLLYFFRNLTQLPSNTIIQIMPVVTILANELAIFWFVKVGEKEALVAISAAVLSIFSFNTTVGMHAGILSNWLAMALGFTTFGLVLKFQQKMSLKLIFAAILTSVSVFLIHYWSGIFFLVVLGCYILLVLLERRRPSARFLVVIVLLGAVILVALLSSGMASFFFASYGTAENTGLLGAFALFSTRLPIFIDSWFFGTLANPVMITLALIGIVVCFHKNTNFYRILISWTAVGSLLSVLVSPIGRNMNQWLMWRTLYLIPFQIPATLGMFFIVAKLGSLKQNEHSVQCDDEDIQLARFSPSFPEKKNLMVIVYLTIDYAISALLLVLDLPILVVLIFFNCLAITLIVHFKLRKGHDNSILVFMFVIFVTLLLFNYALRSLAPLTVHRMQL